MSLDVQLLTVSNVLENIRGRWVVCVSTSLAVILVGILLIMFLPKKYEVQALIEVDWGMGSPQSSSALEGSFVGSIFGDLGNSGLEIHRAIAAILTREFVGQFLQDNKLMPAVFPKYWDAESKNWLPPFDGAPPTLRQGQRRFVSFLEIEVQSDTDFVSIVLRHSEPDKALILLDRFILEANRHLHDRELVRSERILLAVENALAESQSQFIHQTMIQAFKNEVQKKVLLSLDSDLPLRVIDRPVLPEGPSWPSKLLILALSLFFAVIIVLTIGLYDVSKKERPSGP